MSARKSALHWDDPEVFLECLDDPKSIIHQEFVKAVQKADAEDLLEIMEELEEREMLAGKSEGATTRCIERIQKALAE